MKISLLMSTYNGEKYIEEQLDSLLWQTRPIDEVMIIDDCSTDNTVNVIIKYIEFHGLSSTWKVKVNSENKGWRNNFFDGMDLTSGDILFFCDQDDVWFKDKVEKVYNVLITNYDISVVASKETLWKGVKKNKLVSDISCVEKIKLDATGKEYMIRCSGCTMAMKRTYINKIQPYYTSGWAHDDFFWKMGIVDECIALLQCSTILHRIHGKNESRKKRNFTSTVNGLDVDLRICKQLLRYIDDNKMVVNLPEVKIKTIKHREKGTQLRINLFNKKDIKSFFKIVFHYSDIYRRKRQIIGDLLLALNLK